MQIIWAQDKACEVGSAHEHKACPGIFCEAFADLGVRPDTAEEGTSSNAARVYYL